MKVNIAKLLKTKNRIAGEVCKLKADIKKWNSQPVNSAEDVDIRALMERYDKRVGDLVLVKSEIAKANKPVVHKIFELAEAKSKISWIPEIPVTRGKVESYRSISNEYVEWNAVINRVEQEAIVASLQKVIDDLQDELDAYNAVTRVEIPDSVME